MAKRKARNQTGNLTLNHGKSGIDSIPLCAGGVQHAVGKLLTRATTLVHTLSRSEVYTRSYSPAKLWDYQPWRFQESRDKKPFGCHSHRVVHSILCGGKWWLPPNPGRGESCESRVARGFS
jgi:hypothetical protein